MSNAHVAFGPDSLYQPHPPKMLRGRLIVCFITNRGQRMLPKYSPSRGKNQLRHCTGILRSTDYFLQPDDLSPRLKISIV